MRGYELFAGQLVPVNGAVADLFTYLLSISSYFFMYYLFINILINYLFTIHLIYLFITYLFAFIFITQYLLTYLLFCVYFFVGSFNNVSSSEYTVSNGRMISK
jgi:hypothetical protein